MASRTLRRPASSSLVAAVAARPFPAPGSLLACAGLVALLVVLATYSLPAAAANIYRYVDRNGLTVFDSRIPPEYAKNGYTILNDRGQVIQVVPPAPTAEELAAIAAAEAEERSREEARKMQQEADNLLIRLYRSPDEIAKKRDDRLGQLDVQTTALNVSIGKADIEIARLQQIVTNNRNAQKEPPAEITEQLRVQEEEKARLALQLTRIEEERAVANAEAERDIKRLSELLGLPTDAAAVSE